MSIPLFVSERSQPEMTVEEGPPEAVRVALLGPDGPTGTFSHAKLGTLPW